MHITKLLLSAFVLAVAVMVCVPVLYGKCNWPLTCSGCCCCHPLHKLINYNLSAIDKMMLNFAHTHNAQLVHTLASRSNVVQ